MQTLAAVCFADAVRIRAYRDDQKLCAVLSSYLDSYDGAPLMAWQDRDPIPAPGVCYCDDYTTGGVEVMEQVGTVGAGPWVDL